MVGGNQFGMTAKVAQILLSYEYKEALNAPKIGEFGFKNEIVTIISSLQNSRLSVETKYFSYLMVLKQALGTIFWLSNV